MAISYCILVCGREPNLLETRRLVLESAGYRVLIASATEAIIKILVDEAVDLTILCHTMSFQDCLAAMAAIHSYHPEATVISLEADRTPCELGPKVQVVSIFGGPSRLLATVQEALDSVSSAKRNPSLS